MAKTEGGEELDVVPFFGLVVIIWQLNTIRVTLEFHLTDEQLRERRRRVMWGRDK